MCISCSEFLFCRCTRASKSGFIPWDMIWLHYTTFCFFPSSLSFGPFQPLQSFSYLFCSSHYFSPSVCFSALWNSHFIHFVIWAWLMNYASLPFFLHLSLSVCLALSQHPLVTRFPSLLPPPSVNQRKSDKIRPLTLWFVFTHITLVFFPPPYLLSLGYAEWNFMALYAMWVVPGWLVGYGEGAIKALLRLSTVLLSTPYKPDSVAEGGE